MDIRVSCPLDLGLGHDTSLGLLTTSLGTLIGLSENPMKKNELKVNMNIFWKKSNSNIPILKYVLDVKCFSLKCCFQLT